MAWTNHVWKIYKRIECYHLDIRKRKVFCGSHSTIMLMKKRHMLVIIGLFLIVLTFFRIQWMDIFSDHDYIDVENGQLDVMDWQAEDREVLLLDGEWEFYPSQWLFADGKATNIDERQGKLVHVPGGWNDDLHDGEATSFGYGSYRLHIQVDPDQQLNYSMYYPSIRSASEVYVNGRLVAGSGRIGEEKEAYQARNLPYTTTFAADEDGKIEIVVQAANFKDIRRSGIIRSIKFGSESAINKERNLSLSMQVIAAGLLVIHAIYAFALYFLGNRDKRLIYFSIFLFSVTLMNLLSSDDKILHLLVNISYEWDFRIANIIGPIAGYSLIRCLDHRLIPYWRIIHPIYLAGNVLFILVIVVSTPGQILSLLPVNGMLTSIAMVVAVIVLARKLYKKLVENLLLLLSFIAIVHNLFWMMYWRESGISVVHYPFDYLIAVGLFTIIWFKDYFSVHAETRKLATELQTINKHKDQFLANTSHEFKNPLHGIINMSESILIRERHLMGERSIRELETILTVGQRMSLLLNDLLDVASLREGSPRIKRHNMEIQSVIQGVLDMLQVKAEIKPIIIKNDVPEDFPPIFADEHRVVQVMYNLLHNAKKFTDAGEIQIQAEVNGDRAYITISDTGKGMDEAFLKRLFIPYEQASHSDIIDSGLGLGLSISKQLIELHGGQLDVASEVGIGSRFTFSFELASGDEGDTNRDVQSINEPKRHDIQPDVSPGSSQDLALAEVSASEIPYPLRDSITEQTAILVVDDDPVNLQVLESILSVDQYEVTTALSGMDALQKLNKGEFSLVITDVMMPNMSGYELTKEIRCRFTLTELPVLLVTARSEPNDIQTGFKVGANDYVTKPVERLELLSRVKALTTVKNAVREQLHLEAVWLQAQIQPHFIFNTLNSIAALSEIDLKKMNDLLVNFSNFLRSKYQFQYIDELISIEEEFHIVQSYLNIEQVRFGDRLEVVWKISKHEMVKVPFLSVQPLVENAINHGVMERISGGKVTISTVVQEDHVIVSVEDDGVGMDEATLQNLLERKAGVRTSIGLINTNQRLMRSLGTELHIHSKLGQGTIISFVVPTSYSETSTRM